MIRRIFFIIINKLIKIKELIHVKSSLLIVIKLKLELSEKKFLNE